MAVSGLGNCFPRKIWVRGPGGFWLAGSLTTAGRGLFLWPGRRRVSGRVGMGWKVAAGVGMGDIADKQRG